MSGRVRSRRAVHVNPVVVVLQTMFLVSYKLMFLGTVDSPICLDFPCPSNYAHSRLAHLFVIALVASSPQDVSHVHQLWEGLVFHLSRAHSQVQSKMLIWAKELAGRTDLSCHSLEELAGMNSDSVLSSFKEHMVPSIVLGALFEHYRQSEDNFSENNRWLSRLLSVSLDHFCLVDIAEAWLSSDGITQNIWSGTILPALLVKLKSHPDKALPVVSSWLAAAGSRALPLPSEEWRKLVIKQIQSSKVENRSIAHTLIQKWGATSRVNGSLVWLEDLVHAKVALAPARLDLLHGITKLANSTMTRVLDKSYSDQAVLALSKSFIDGLCSLARKETTHKSASWQATISLCVLFHCIKRSLDPGSCDNVRILVESIAEACLKQSDQAVHILPLLVYGCPTMEIRRQLACEMWKASNWSAAMQKIVQNSKPKKADAALFALYWSLIHYSPQNGSFPVWINKVLNASNSFLFSGPGSVESHPGVVANCLSLAHSKTGSSFFSQKKEAFNALVLCITSPQVERKDKDMILAALTDILKSNVSNFAQELSDAIWNRVEEVCLEKEELEAQQNSTRQARENDMRPLAYSSRKVPWSLVRKVAQLLIPEAVSEPKLWVLSHARSSLRLAGCQRKALMKLANIHLMDVNVDGFVSSILGLGSMSDANHRALLSLWTTLGRIGGQQPDEDEEDSVKKVVSVAKALAEAAAKSLCTKLDETLSNLMGLTERDIALFRSASGVPFRENKVESSTGDNKKRMSEEEEWEEQMKKELAEKKKATVDGTAEATLSPEDKALIEEQRLERQRMKALFRSLQRFLESLEQMVLSDIEIGNNLLVISSKSVLTVAVLACPAFEGLPVYRQQAYRVLKAMATCVYEVEEKFAPDIAQSLLISCRTAGSTAMSIDTVALPSPCVHAASLVHEVDIYGDLLSRGSFVFILPVLKAVIHGPRTPQGCESALEIVGRHTLLLDDPVLKGVRKEVAISVLELLRHDRAQAFHQPSPFEVLVACYQATAESDDILTLTTSELAPLLDDRGALGSRNCRIASMMALEAVASVNGKLVKQDPLNENRVWVNCFSSEEEIRRVARKTWFVMHGVEDETMTSPSAFYAAPLLPLLSSDDSSIAEASAKAFAYALAMHKSSMNRNIESLCKAYIVAFPTIGQRKQSSKSSDVSLSVTPVPKKKPASALLPKKKPASKTPAGLAGIGKPKIGTKKKLSSAATKAMMKPKEERQLGKDELEIQFRVETTDSDEQKDTPSYVATRIGVLRTLGATTNKSVPMNFELEALSQLTSFFITYGIAEVDENVKTRARNTFCEIIAAHGGSEEAVAFLLPQLETVLKSGVADETGLGSLPSSKVPRDLSALDRRKEGAVVALGSVALHLKGPENEDKVDSTVDMLLSVLTTPSEDVQASVADALSKLMKKGRTPERIQQIVNGLVRDCLHGSSLATRRGAAYGLSAAVKGSGIGTLKKLEVVNSLEEAFASGTSNNKEGALFAIELLTARLGLLFEPYVIVLLPSLLTSFSDGSEFVRKAAADTAGLIMSKLSAHGVKLVTPAVLAAFDDPAWRTKQASIHMLGAMSHLAPKQLAAALPKIVPKLSEAFGDTHPKVRESAQESLHEISMVIRNPEIKSISPTLLKALTDPADYTQPALEQLIGTEFLHSIDAPSLALIVPILHRGLRDRGATVKRMGGLIAGNICTMINDPRDFIPYVPTLLPDLQLSLLDPIPDVRGTAAKALGSLARNLGDQILPELRPWLVKKLREDICSSAERSGAAQGLTEVLIASGTETVDEAMRNEILPLRSHPESSTREGVLWMLTFLPPALGQGFTGLIDVSLPALVGGLSDENELVRDVAMRAGRVLIRSHGKVHVDKILPSLEVGLGDDDHRIRVASLSLLGDLLSMIGGTTVTRGDGDTQDDIRKAEKAQAQIALVLGVDTRKRVLSELYLARSDGSYLVRQSALQVWKTVVSVTARTLRDILSMLVSRIIDNLASGHHDRTVSAAQCLGDIVTRLSDSVLPQIIPVLRDTLKTGDDKTKLGVCVGLNEVIKCSSKEQISKYIEIIVKLVQDAISVDNDDVRAMAASSFQSLHTIVGSRAFDEVVPSLMVALEYDEDETSRARALNGLTGILAVRSRELLPYILPRLIKSPISTKHAEALARVAEVTTASIHYHFPQIIPALLFDLSDAGPEDEARLNKLRGAVRSICFHVDEGGVNSLISEIASKCPSDKASIRRESCFMFEMMIEESKLSFPSGFPL